MLNALASHHSAKSNACMDSNSRLWLRQWAFSVETETGLQWLETCQLIHTANVSYSSDCATYIQLSDFPAHCSAKCLNGGKCIGANKCQCPDAFRGPQCQHATEKCSPKKFGFNGSYNCLGSENEMSCSLNCPEGVKFEFPPVSIYKCKFSEGRFSPSSLPKCVYAEGVEVVRRAKLYASRPQELTSERNENKFTNGWREEIFFLHFPATCSSSCRNGGSCADHNTCQCPEDFTGPQCQYSIDHCSPKTLGFNGGYKCSGTATGMSCTISCPAGIQFDKPSASKYDCNYDTGRFTPSLPKCVYGKQKFLREAT